VLVDLILTIIFTIEAILKIISLGFLFNGNESYLRNSWNIIDFTIVLISVSITIDIKLILDFISSDSNFKPKHFKGFQAS
jgi:hypothetical protein